MAEKLVDTPDGSIVIELDRATLMDGNEAIREAYARASADAAVQGRKLRPVLTPKDKVIPDSYGAKVEGEKILVTFAFLPDQPKPDQHGSAMQRILDAQKGRAS